MRVLFFMPLATRSGSELALYNLICYAAAKGWDVAVACRTSGELLEQLPPNVTVFVYETSSTFQRSYAALSRRVMGDADGFPGLVHAKFKPDIWYVNTILQPWIVKQAEAKRIPCVLHTHELEQMLSRITETETESLVTSPRLVIASSESARDVFTTLGRRERIEVCYATIDPSRIKFDAERSAAFRRSLGAGEDTFLWTMVGSMDPNKNPARFVEIARAMLQRGLNVQFLWIGSSDNGYSRYVKNIAEAPELAGKLKFLDTPGADYFDWLNAANGLVITSYKESLSLVAAEMAYLGKPVVSFDCGGIREIVREGMGVVIDSWNNTDLIAAMTAVMKGEIFFDPAIGAERAKEFSIAVQGPRWIDIMQQHFAG